MLPFFLELLVIALHSSPVEYWTPSDLGRGSSSGVISFCFFHIIHGILLEIVLESVAISSSSGSHFVRTLHYNLSWVSLNGMAHSLIELCNPLRHD